MSARITGGDGTSIDPQQAEEDLLQNAMKRDAAPTWMTVEEIEAAGYELTDFRFGTYRQSLRRLDSGLYVEVFSVGRELYQRVKDGARRLGATGPGST